MAGNNDHETCFHCGLPIPDGFDTELGVLDKSRRFCCHGCRAVAKAILDAGLDDYYRHRTVSAAAVEPRDLTAVIEKLNLYDHADLQKHFVRTRGDLKQAFLLLEDIRCAACLWLNEQRLRSLPGVHEVEIDYASQQARVQWDPATIRLSEILRAIAELGYVAHPFEPSRREQILQDRKHRSTERLIFAAVIGMVVMQFALASYLMGGPQADGRQPLWIVIGRWTSLIATTALLAYPGQEFFRAAWRDLTNRRLGMDVPIVLGMSAAYAASAYATLMQEGDVYFDSIAMFILFLLTARVLEFRGRVQAADALDRVSRVLPRTARRIDDAGNEHTFLVADLEPGDRVRVLPGETVPTDGVLAEGASSFDESLLTGESLPVERRAGDTALGGSVNIDQPVVVETTRTGLNTMAAEISALLEHGLQSVPRYAILAQRAAFWFVSAVLVIALLTAGLWLWVDSRSALPNTVAVLIVTCPCALALATPVAYAVSAGRFAALGVLPVRMDAVERLARCKAVAFDKTGTLTLGQLSLNSVRLFGAIGESQALRYAAALEQGSMHPVALALRSACPQPGVAVSALRVATAAGVEGVIDGKSWRLGKPEFSLAQGHASPEFVSALAAARTEGGLVAVLAVENRAVSLFSFTDPLRAGAHNAVSGLRRTGIDRIAVLSGDHPDNVFRIAGLLGVTEALGNQSPADKLRWLENARREGGPVAMVGDGVNDAPTLAAADVSLSFADATELAQTHSDFLILNKDIRLVPAARRLARQTHRVIVQNLAWAAGYNLLAVPAAALGFVPPWGAAIGMSLSSLLVILNSTRLRRFEPYSEGETGNPAPT